MHGEGAGMPYDERNARRQVSLAGFLWQKQGVLATLLERFKLVTRDS